MTTEKFKLLMADDEYWVRQNLKAMIDWEEYAIDFMDMACDGEEALDKIEADCPDILITDINMPFISGIELMSILKKRHPDIKVIVLSGYSEFEYARQALHHGAVDYLLKPIVKEDLLDIVTKCISEITEKRKLEKEKKDTEEKLYVAKSMIQDRKFSELIDNNKADDIQDNYIPEALSIWPGFNKFTLIVVKIDKLVKICKRTGVTDPNKLLHLIKGHIYDNINHGGMVFNNIFVPNEFIVLTSMNKSEIDIFCDKAMRSVREMTRSEVSVAISRSYPSIGDIRSAYNDALLAMMTRKFSAGSYKIYFDDINNLTFTIRITSEQENQLIFAVQNRNKRLINKVLYEDIEIQKLYGNKAVFLEVKQIIDKVAWIVYNYSVHENSPNQILAIDNLVELLNMTLESFNMSDVCNVIDQIVDECLDSNDLPGSNETVKHVVKQAVKYIDENYFEDISLSTLADTFHISKTYLSKAFKHEAGLNVMLYIAKKRIEKSIEYMKQDDLSLTEIASLVGYDDYAYFNRVFRKFMGKGPREYKSNLNLQK